MLDLARIRDNFKLELESASSGKKSSLPFIRIELPPQKTPLPGQYQVLVIGGTNCSTAIVARTDEHVELLDIKKEGFAPFKSGMELYEYIFRRINPDLSFVCLNLAFPMESIVRNGYLDGTFLMATKEHVFDDLIGKNMGKELENYVFEKSGRQVKFIVANDTICLLLSGISVTEPQNIVGAILGTGFNLAIYENPTTLVNIEAAAFSNFEPTDSGKEIDIKSLKPGEHLFEKEVAGAYLYEHFNYSVEKRNIATRPINSTEELYAVAHGGSEDTQVVELAREIFDRSAGLVAAALSALAEYKNCDIDVVLQGGMFTNEYRDHLLVEFEKLTSYSMRFYKIDNSSRIGAAFLI